MQHFPTRLTYCTNIHAGEAWQDHFRGLQEKFPAIKTAVSPDQPMNIGLRLSNQASLALLDESRLQLFKQWLHEQQAYVALINGFPYGDFHQQAVKENVHAPDWTRVERRDYTLRLVSILASLLPEDVDGGISTAPLGYRHWYNGSDESWENAVQQSTAHVIDVVLALYELQQNTGKIIHLDIEPEADGILENGEEFLNWYLKDLLPTAIPAFKKHHQLDAEAANHAIKQHLRICYDVCHFALGFENHQQMLDKFEAEGILIGRFQISAALKGFLSSDEIERLQTVNAFGGFDEPLYLHQVVAKTASGDITRYRDLSDALDLVTDEEQEWRSHFHVPVFLDDFDVLTSTQDDIVNVLSLNQQRQLTSHLEVETYTWQVLPMEYQLPIEESISRELLWVKTELQNLANGAEKNNEQ